jgi:nucleotide-binding universal stress UspA family protein
VYSKILVPLDGSKFSEGVLPYVRSLAAGLEVPVELLGVIDSVPVAPDAPADDGREYLQRMAASFSAIADVQCIVETGNPAARIVDLAAAEPGRLIAMATHGYSGAQRWLLGSVAEKVLHGAANHLLLVRPGEGDPAGEAHLRTVVVPLDGSGLAEAVLPVVRELALRLKLEVVLVRVLPHVYSAPPDALLPVFGMNLPNQREIRARERSAATEYLNGKVEHLRAAGLSEVSSLVIDGSAGGAAAEIIDLAKKTSNNLVAMSTHGASGIGRWLVGNVTERVVRYSSDPVLVIRPRS